MEDPSGAWEWIFTIFASLFGLFLVLCLVSSIWHYLIRRPATAIRNRGRAAHHGLARELPPPRAPEQARRELVESFGGLPALNRDLEARLAVRAREILTREPKEAELKTWSTDLTNDLLRRWGDAFGEVPRLRSELPPRSFAFPTAPKRFVRDWNEHDWLHEDGQGPLTVEELRIGPTMSPQEYVDWNLDRWAWELEQQVGLSCWDVLFIPIFAFMIPSSLLSTVLPNWAAFGGGLLLAVPIMRWWIWARKTGRVAFGDD